MICLKVAIIGAGVSGLSCAYELEKNGVNPVIFEKRSHIGEGLAYTGLWPHQFMRTYFNPLLYLKRKYGINLTPLSSVREITMYSPGKKLTVRGNHGCIFKRGVEKYSLENQFASNLSSPVIFDRYIESINDIRNDFSHIVVACAGNLIPKELGVWNDAFSAQGRVATIVGNFDPSACFLWLNTRYANNSFAYIIPNSAKEASLVLLVNNIASREMDYYWNEFQRIEDIKAVIIQTRDIEHFAGYLDSYQIGNIYITGNSAGFTDNLLGIGAFNAIESGIFAARAIMHKLDYNSLVQPIVRNIQKLGNVRSAMNNLDNDGFDRFIGILKAPVIKQLVYKNPLFRFNNVSSLAKLYNKFYNNQQSRS